ncbi:GerAB/ArcD/ProY family transporter [Serpentinicella alkaliphila]|uniref:Spore germination protein n=1 Tax=Serpentinicella alkaliphila TaxID=1734049 RepID=A0A4R2TG38_9FIRM|nr:endospore germination permease [Serpentinicella alkaliphila]QUH25335.1 endospore germination permease [Serpentinicella alkaliphila]TCQ02378.1 spore germination protein [Serpentinicella alkaliphila]
MYKNNDKISLGQLVHILMLTIVGVGVLTLPSAITEELGVDGVFVLLIGGALVLVIANLIGRIMKLFPGKSYTEILSACFTKPIAYIIIFLFLIYSLVINAFVVRVFGEVVKMYLLIRTPIEVIIFSMLLITAYLARKGIEPLGRAAELLFPLIMVPAVILFILAAADVDPTNFLPIFQASPIDIIRGVPTALFAFAAFEFMLIFGKFLSKTDQAPKALSIGMGIVIAVYVLIFAVALGVFGEPQLKHLIWPTLSLFKIIEFPGLFIENVESLVMVIWVFIVFMSIAPVHLGKTVLIGELLNLKERDFFALPLVPILYLTALIPESVAETYRYMDIFSKYAIPFFALILPILIFLVGSVRKGKGKESGGRA